MPNYPEAVPEYVQKLVNDMQTKPASGDTDILDMSDESTPDAKPTVLSPEVEATSSGQDIAFTLDQSDNNARFMARALELFYKKYGKKPDHLQKAAIEKRLKWLSNPLELVKSKVYGVIPKRSNNPKGIAKMFGTGSGTKVRRNKSVRWHAKKGA